MRKFILIILIYLVAFPLSNTGASETSKAKNPFPLIHLDKKLNQEEAIIGLGNKLPEVAAWHGLSASELEKILRSDKTIWVDETGQLLYIDETPVPSNGVAAGVSDITFSTGLFPDNQTFTLHSSPNSKKIIYLDFDGDILHANAWTQRYNAGNDIIAPPFNTDGNSAVFSTSELHIIQNIWQRVAEDYAPFDVDVTTEAPTVDRLSRSSTSDEYYGTKALISPISSYFGNYGGIAYVNIYDMTTDYYKPALIFPENLAPTSSSHAKYVAEAVSHEIGHNLGLTHDGSATSGYYSGHGSGATGWAPIMGVGYYQNLSEWSKGEYLGANNFQDDLQILANYLGYYPDDAPNTIINAKPLTVNGSSISTYGVIEQRGDVDVFSFNVVNSNVSITALPVVNGPNLDIKMELVNAQGSILATSNNLSVLDSTISQTLQAGTYYLFINGIGKGDLATGYSDYGSLGQYKISGQIGINPNPVTEINAPSLLTAKAQKKVVTLKWNDNSSNEEGFYVERAINTSVPVYQRIGEVAANSTQFTQTVSANTYLYRVQAFNKTTGKVSLYSNTYSIKVR